MNWYITSAKNFIYYKGYDVPRLTSKSDPRRLLPSARMVSRNVHEPSAIKGHNLPELTNLVQVWGQFFAHDISGTPAHKGVAVYDYCVVYGGEFSMANTRSESSVRLLDWLYPRETPDGRDLKCCDGVFLTENQQIHRDAFNGGRCNPIYIPPMDRHFTYSCMNLARSMAAKRARDCDKNAPRELREQMNMLTAWIDASHIYGSKMKKADQLRVYRKGLLRVTAENLLPEDRNSTCVKEDPGDYCFLAGEKRVNEHAALMALHIVFHRFHNRLALKMSQMNPRWTDETIYQEVRRIMGAIMQHLTYHDWLPTVLGPSIMRQYGLNVLGPSSFGPTYWRYIRCEVQISRLLEQWLYGRSFSRTVAVTSFVGYKMNPTITNVFATAAFRFGHTMIPSLFTMGDNQVRLFTMFNRPKFILRDRGKGLKQMCSGIINDPVHHSDRFMSPDLSDRLFEDKNNVSMDLASLNIQRARDHGLPPYNDYRKYCNLPVYETFDEMYESEPERAEIFRRVYDDVKDIDIFAGGLSEKPLSGAVVGPTFACLIAKQFQALKFADRYWYESPDGPGSFKQDQLAEIRKMTLGRIMCMTAEMRNVPVNPLYKAGSFMSRGVLMPNGVFVTQNRYVACGDLPDLDYTKWYDPGAQISG
ncbi:hypothetical protein BaRGS_00000313 [Batillaria attramentaria]|uniref:Uncharacterized protein n=1 Tax=Batillaria attramentaria TaxID=370345 RepID=A0ABD0MC42_9CAEN